MIHHGFSLTELNEMFPFERELYMILLVQHIEEREKDE